MLYGKAACVGVSMNYKQRRVLRKWRILGFQVWYCGHRLADSNCWNIDLFADLAAVIPVVV